jgi:hypothetical protein
MKAKTSFESTFGQSPQIEGPTAYSSFDGVNLTVTYRGDYQLGQIEMVGNLADIVRIFSPRLVFPPLPREGVASLVRSLYRQVDEEPPLYDVEHLIYRIGDDVIMVAVIKNTKRVVGISRLWEGYYEQEV